MSIETLLQAEEAIEIFLYMIREGVYLKVLLLFCMEIYWRTLLWNVLIAGHYLPDLPFVRS
jgi:hypothetical protein